MEILQDLQQERRRLLRRLTKEHEIAMGSVSLVYRKCGNPRCHCVQGPAHPHVLFLFTDKKTGQRRCKLIRRADEKRMLQAGKRYKEFRNDMMRLRAIDKQEKQILMALTESRSIHYE
ncbi:MAG: hypothetical protein KJ831_05950 [Candidatus Eisenbacteria bacterium]|nr:hypothetical protein [Candidatus Eisenbacteria bacterium]